MRFSVIGTVRLIIVLGLFAATLGIAIARMEPSPARFRIINPPACAGINAMFFSVTEERTRFLDTESGQFIEVAFPEGDDVDYPQFSQWRDDQGGSQLVGRWARRVDQGSGRTVEAVGLARFRFPSGEPIDRVRLDLVPVGNPCWFPDASPRIVFAAGDGQLYQFHFARNLEDSPSDESELHPKPLTWRCRAPGLGRLFIADPIWFADARLKNHLLVSLSYRIRGNPGMILSPPELWWLEIDPDGAAIISAGRLSGVGQPSSPEASGGLRLPSVSTTPEGNLFLAYLGYTSAGHEWDLHVAPLSFDTRTGVPRVSSDRDRVLANHCVATVPIFSPRGDSVYALRRPEGRTARLERFATAERPSGDPVSSFRAAPSATVIGHRVP